MKRKRYDDTAGLTNSFTAVAHPTKRRRKQSKSPSPAPPPRRSSPLHVQQLAQQQQQQQSGANAPTASTQAASPATPGQLSPSSAPFSPSRQLSRRSVPLSPTLMQRLTYHPNFGRDVRRAFARDKARSAAFKEFAHGLRVDRYGIEVATKWKAGSTPEELRAEAREREERVLREMLESTDSDSEDGREPISAGTLVKTMVE